MKNKGKKILAGVALGVMGAMTLTGCSMSAEDIEKWETKADTVVETLTDLNTKLTEQNENLTEQNATLTESNENLVGQNELLTEANENLSNQKEQLENLNENLINQKGQLENLNENLTNQNSHLEEQNELLSDLNSYYLQLIEQIKNENAKITKKEALDKIQLARQQWYFMLSDEMKMHGKIDAYNGYGEIDEEGGQEVIYIYRNKNNVSTAFYCIGGYEDFGLAIGKSDFTNDIHYDYEWSDDEDSFDLVEYEATRFMGGIYFDSFEILDLINSNITEDNIYNIEKTENGYKISLMFNTINRSEYVGNGENQIFLSRTIIDVYIENDKIITVTGDIFSGTYIENGLSGVFATDENGNYLNPDHVFNIYQKSCEDINVYKFNFDYEYENIDFTDLDTIIAEIENEYLNN